MTNDFPTYEERTAEILGRYTVTDLIEQTDADLQRGDELFAKGDSDIEILDEGMAGVIRFWHVRSKDRVYECRRFRNFVWCECPSFFYRKKMCRHLALTAGVLCSNCRQLRAHKEKLCVPCYDERYRFLKPNNLQETTA